MSFRYVWLLLFSPLLMGCPAAKEPCDSEIVRTKVEILSVEPYSEAEYTATEKTAGAEYFHIVTEFWGSSLGFENQQLETLINMKVDSAFLVKNKIRIGSRYFVTVSDPKPAGCHEVIVSFDHRFEPTVK